MRMLLCGLSVFALLMFTAMGMAAEPAATAELPSALQSMGVSWDAVVTEDQAHQVRGMWTDGDSGDNGGSGGDGGNGTDGGPVLTQTKSFKIEHGVATGTTTILEGVFGTFTYVEFQNGDAGGTSLTIEGTFGGLTGTIGTGPDGFQFSVLGKALQETISFAGKYSQDFSQSVTIPVR